MLRISEKVHNQLKSRIRIRIRIRIRTKITPDPQHRLQPGLPQAAHLAAQIPGPLAHVLYSIPVTAKHPTGCAPGVMDSWSPGSCSVLYSCYSLASHGLRTWRRGFLVPWFMFYLILICLLFMVLAHSLSFQNLQLKQVTG